MQKMEVQESELCHYLMSAHTCKKASYDRIKHQAKHKGVIEHVL